MDFRLRDNVLRPSLSRQCSLLTSLILDIEVSHRRALLAGRAELRATDEPVDLFIRESVLQTVATHPRPRASIELHEH